MDDMHATMGHARARTAEALRLELAVVIPTFNEAGNVAEVVRRLDRALAGRGWEAIFVDDDSPDGTAEAVRRIAIEDPRIRVIRRIGRRGLSSACVEGMLATAAPAIAVIDGDLQHDERLLPAMLDALWREDADIVVGSRYVDGGGVGEWNSRRVAVSRLATRLGQLAIGVTLTDPMSGFFLLRRETIEAAAHDLSGVGFKILLDIFASSPAPLKAVEIPYTFRPREVGESKLDNAAAMDFAVMLLDKTVGRYVPVKFLIFSAVGGLGLVIHLMALFLGHRLGGLEFGVAQTIATLTAMTFNFFVNNTLTYRDRRLRGWAMLRGWASFSLACSVGAIANIGIAVYVFENWAAGGALTWVWSAVAGVLVGAVWNYAVTAVYTWGRR